MILNNTGKWGLSAAQTAGILAATTVGVIGVGMMMTGSSDVNPDTAFSSNDDNYVYVTGNTSGMYHGVGYVDAQDADGGEIRSAIRVKQSRSLQLMEEDSMKQPEPVNPSNDDADEIMQAYKMDGAQNTGLNMGNKGFVDSGNPGKGDLSALQQQMADMQAMIASKQQEAGAAASAGKLPEGVSPEGLIGPDGKPVKIGQLDRNGGMAGAGGGSFGAEGLRPTGVNRSNEVQTPQGADSPSIQSTTPRTAQYDGGRDAVIEAGKEYRVKGEDEVEQYLKFSAELAKDGNRSANAVTQFALAGRGNNGIMIVGGQVTTGGASSSDFEQVASVPGKIGENALLTQFAEEKSKLRDALEEEAKKLQESYEKLHNGWGWIPIVHAIKVIKARKRLKEQVEEMDKKVNGFKKQFKDHPMLEDNMNEFLDVVGDIRSSMERKDLFKYWGKSKEKPMNAFDKKANFYWPERAEKKD